MAGPSGKPDPAAAQKLRLDKWLWQARFFKSRSIAAEVIEAGSVRVNGTRISRPGRDISVTLYTSGTTGTSKGVLPSAERCIAAATDTVRFDKLNDFRFYLAFIP